MTFTDASPSDIPVIRTIADKTWWPAYSPILPPEQIHYMLNAIYAPETLSHVMLSGAQNFILLSDNNTFQGFAAYGRRPDDPNVFKLHKLYVLPDHHKRGYGRALVNEVCRRITAEGSRILDLNVNRYNPARTFYEKLGFSVIREEDVPVGPYWMNDYVMRLTLPQPEADA